MGGGPGGGARVEHVEVAGLCTKEGRVSFVQDGGRAAANAPPARSSCATRSTGAVSTEQRRGGDRAGAGAGAAHRMLVSWLAKCARPASVA